LENKAFWRKKSRWTEKDAGYHSEMDKYFFASLDFAMEEGQQGDSSVSFFNQAQWRSSNIERSSSKRVGKLLRLFFIPGRE